MTQQLLPVEGFAVLHHVLDDKGKFQGVIAETVIGFAVDSSSGQFTPVTPRGQAPDNPLYGPEGEVTLPGQIWASVDEYTRWAKENLQ